MEEVTSKRRGRPRKDLGVPTATRQAEKHDRNEPDHGQAGDAGAGAQEQVSADPGWPDFVEAVTRLHYREKRLRTVFHPNPRHGHIVLPNITLAVISGPLAGQLNDGQMIDIV